MEDTQTRSRSAKQFVIKVGHRFDFNAHREFRAAYVQCPPGAEYVVDLSDTNYLDSSALGMLLLLREHAGGETANVTLLGCRDEVRKVLTISNFQNLFRML